MQLDTIQQCWLSRHNNTRDYKYFRSKMIELIGNKTNGYTDFNNLEQYEIDAACNMVALPIEYIYQYISDDNILNNIFINWSLESKKARIKRFEIAKMYVFRNIVEGKQLMIFLNNSDFVANYYEGIEGSEEDGVDGLFDWILSRENSQYEFTGMRNSNYTLINTSWQNLEQQLMQILKYGNY